MPVPDANRSDAPRDPGRGVDTSTHPLVAKLLAATGGPPAGVVALVGFFGPRGRPDRARLYAAPDLSVYYDIPDPEGGPADAGAIVLTLPADPSNPFSPSLVFVKAGAMIDYVEETGVSSPASFLKGSIASANLAAAVPGAAPHAGAHHPEVFALTQVGCKPTSPCLGFGAPGVQVQVNAGGPGSASVMAQTQHCKPTSVCVYQGEEPAARTQHCTVTQSCHAPAGPDKGGGPCE